MEDKTADKPDNSDAEAKLETAVPAESKYVHHKTKAVTNLHHHPYIPPHVAYPHRVRRLGAVFLLIVILAVSFLGGWLGAISHDSQSTSDSLITNSKQTVVTTESQAITNIAKNVGQSVVSIDASQDASSQSSDLSGLDGSSGTGSEDAGTGIIISSDGLIITNRHVIPDGTTSVSVTLSDGTTYDNVQVVGRTSDDSSLDIAFLKIQDTKGKKLVPATIGDSSNMSVGDPVVAIGNALGQFQNTVTSGIISGFGRSVQASDSTGSVSENLDDLFQTDAAINEGNSGGPLVNLSGQVIGINTAIASDSQNIGFAIPINDVTGLIKSVETTGQLQQPYLGVIFIPITSDVAQQYNLSVTNGAWVPPSSIVGETSIISGGPADKAGIKEGDIITAVNGTAINQSTSLTSIIDKETVGNVVSLTINRSGKSMTLNVTLGAAPTNTGTASN
jgi:S1-C subfamily serine protease